MVDFGAFECAAKALKNSIRMYLTLADRVDIERWLSSVSD